MRRVLAWILLSGLVLVGAIYVARRPVFIAIGGFLIAQDPLHPADAIVVLSGSFPDRILEGIDLFQAHLAPRVILTREPALPGIEVVRARGSTVLEPHEQNLRIADDLGVPRSALVLLPSPVSSTLQEAKVVIAYLRQQRIHSILLVTSKAHSHRAGMIFRHVARGEVEINVCASRYDPFSPETWWESRGLVRRVILEYGKLLNYLVIDRWRPLDA